MKLDRLLSFTRQPELLATDESQDLETLLQEYPYFSAAQLLLTIKYKKQNSSRFNRQLQRAAAHLPDKNVLAAALNEGLAQLQQLEMLEQQDVISVGTTEESIEEVTTSPEEVTSAIEVALPEVVVSEETPDTIEVLIENSPESELLANEPLQEVQQEINDSREVEADETRERELKKSESELAFGEVDELASAASFLVLETITENSAEPKEITTTINQQEEENQLQPEEQFLTQAHDRLSWFRFFAGKPLREQPDDVLEELYLEHMSGDFLQAESATLPEIKTELKAVVNHNAEVASDKNLEEEIRRLAYESISDEELPASETLAAIYESQKDYKKALRIYQKLMLKFPDRMTYFAGLIATTKEKLNN